MIISKYIPEESRWKEENQIGIVINNMPNMCRDTKYIVCSIYNLQLWFYGQWPEKDRTKAYEVAETIQGVVVELGE